jgi:hypothetical protein
MENIFRFATSPKLRIVLGLEMNPNPIKRIGIEKERRPEEFETTITK